MHTNQIVTYYFLIVQYLFENHILNPFSTVEFKKKNWLPFPIFLVSNLPPCPSAFINQFESIIWSVYNLHTCHFINVVPFNTVSVSHISTL